MTLLQDCRRNGFDQSPAFVATLADIRSSPTFRAELLAQCGLSACHPVPPNSSLLDASEMVARVKHSFPSLPTIVPETLVGQDNTQSKMKATARGSGNLDRSRQSGLKSSNPKSDCVDSHGFSVSSALALQVLHGFVQTELHEARTNVARVARVDLAFSIPVNTRSPTLGFSVHERSSTLGQCGVSKIEDDSLASRLKVR